jgi:hypothetical protein
VEVICWRNIAPNTLAKAIRWLQIASPTDVNSR